MFSKNTLPLIQFLFMLSLSIPVFSYSEEIQIEKFTNEQGLSQNSILCILQDSKGFLWFGTYDGLNRYDGYNFKIYKHSPADTLSISHNCVLKIFEDSQGNLWVGTMNGLNRFDRAKENFTHYKNDPADPGSLSNNYITAIFEDSYGTFWIGTRAKGLNRLLSPNIDTGRIEFQHYIHIPDDSTTLSYNSVYSLFEDSHGNFWIGTATGANLYDRKNDQIIRLKNYPFDSTNTNFENIVSIFEDNKGSVWLSSHNGVNRVDFPKSGLNIIGEETLSPDEIKFIHYENDPRNAYSLGDNQIESLFQDSYGHMWLGTLNGLYQYDFARDRFIATELSDKNDLIGKNTKITALYEDNSGVFWIGTDYNGLLKYNRWKAQFRHYNRDKNNPANTLNDNTVMTIYAESDSILWLGTYSGGVNRFDRKKNKFSYYLNDPNDPASISHNSIRAMHIDNTGRFWIGTAEGLNILDRETQKFTRYMPNSNNIYGLKTKNIWSISEDHSGTIWIGTYNLGLFRLVESPDKSDEKKFIQYIHAPNDPNSLSDDIIWSILDDRNGTLWIGTDRGGLNRFNREKNQFTHYKSDPFDETSISGNQVLCLLEDQNGNIWAGTTSGLNKLLLPKNPGEKVTFKRFTVEHGLPSNTIQALIEDNKGDIWISTNKGISRFNPRNNSFKNFDYKDNLQSNEFMVNSCSKSVTGEIFLGGTNGYNSFYPDSIKENLVVPQVVLIDFQLFNQTVSIGTMRNGQTILDKSITETRQITLSYDAKVFSLEFAALHFCSPEDNQYAYMMEGFEDQWNNARNRRFVTYTNLPAGDYVFRIKASNNDGRWNERSTNLKIKIDPPYWQTLWFKLLVLLTVLLFIFAVYNYRTWTIRKRNSKLEAYAEQRTLELKQKNDELQLEIRERKRAEQTTEDEREKLNITLRSIGEGVITIDNIGRVVILNKVAEELTGWSQSDALAAPFEKVFNISDNNSNKPCHQKVEELLQSKIDINKSNPCTLKSLDGTERIIIFSGAHIIDKSGHVTGMVFVFHDISEQRRVEAELQKASKLESIGILAGGIAHDFNNILTVIMSSVSLAKTYIDSNGTLNDILTDAERASIRAQNLTQQLLTFSKGGMPIKEPTSIGALIKEATQFALRGSRAKFTLSIPEDLWTIEGDRGQISQVIHNMLINANQAMPNGGEVEVTAKNIKIATPIHLPIKSGNYVKISIRDQGIGIDKEHFNKLFDPYFTTKQTGSGLGLTTSYSIISRHDGYIDLESKLGRGTTFFIYLPASRKKILIDKESQKVIPFGQGKILLMDDEPFVRRVAGRSLERLGYAVEYAAEGKTAIEKYKKSLSLAQPFDLLILDLTIPGGMGGKDTIKRLREINPDVRAIVSSGYSNDPVMANFKAYGFSGMVKKPYRLHELAEVLKTVINNSQEKYL